MTSNLIHVFHNEVLGRLVDHFVTYSRVVFSVWTNGDVSFVNLPCASLRVSYKKNLTEDFSDKGTDQRHLDTFERIVRRYIVDGAPDEINIG